MLITLEQARSYAHDNESTDADMSAYIAEAEAYINGAVGAVLPTDPAAKLLCKLLVCEIIDKRSFSTAELNSRSALVSSLILQLKNKTVSNSDTGGAVSGGGSGI